jgi:hypothetical protein
VGSDPGSGWSEIWQRGSRLRRVRPRGVRLGKYLAERSVAPGAPGQTQKGTFWGILRSYLAGKSAAYSGPDPESDSLGRCLTERVSGRAGLAQREGSFCDERPTEGRPGFFVNPAGSPPKKLNFVTDVQSLNVTRLGERTVARLEK